MNYKKMSFISGIVIFFSFVITLLAIVGLAEKRIFFTRDYIIYAKFSDVVGLQDHAKVYMRGYRIGWTKDIEFHDDGVVVRIDINKKFQVPKDSKFELNLVSMLGEKAITIYPGNSPDFLQQDDMVTGENKDLMIEAKKMLGDIRAGINEGELDTTIRKITESINYLHATLRKANSEMAKVNVDVYSTQIQEIGNAGKSLNLMITENSDSLKTGIIKFNLAMTKISSLAEEMNRIAATINQGQGSAGEFVNNKEYIQNLNTTIADLDTLINDFKENPKKYIDLSIF